MMNFQMTKLFLLFNFVLVVVSITCLSFAMPSDHHHEYSSISSSSDEEVFQLFQVWQKEHGREYGNPKEEENRFQIFKRNLRYINEMNAKRSSKSSHRLGLNKFADISPEEFSKTYLLQEIVEMPSINNVRDDRKKLIKDDDDDDSCENLPASVDWREKGAVTEVRDQGDCRKIFIHIPLYIFFFQTNFH